MRKSTPARNFTLSHRKMTLNMKINNKGFASLCFICFLLSQTAVRSQTATQISFKSLLTELTNRESIARFPDGKWTLHQVSSYDRRSKSKSEPGWFANDDWDGYIRKDSSDGKVEYVMMDEDGPGVITRFWVAGHPNKKAHLRFYIDGQTTPFWEADHTGALIGQNKDIGIPLSQRSVDMDFLPINKGAQPGHNLYAPIPFNRHIKITCDKPPGGPDNGLWYNINFRKYEGRQKIESFSSQTPSTCKKELDATNARLNEFMEQGVSRAAAPGETKVSRFSFSLGANEKKSVELTGMSSIRRILLNVANANNDAFKHLWISIQFDGVETVSTPAGFLFGCGDQLLNSKDWYSKVDSGGIMAAYWVMPFRKKAVVELTNRGTTEIAGSLQLASGNWRWDNRSMYFHAAFKDMPDYQTTAQVGTDFNMLTRTNHSGLYVGEVFQVNKNIGGWWGEGDEKIYIDGATFPDHFGTGTEDYFGYAWGHPETFNHIFNSQPIGDANRSDTGGTTVDSRKRSLDAIPFNSSFVFDMESWNWHGGPVNFKWTSMWYELPAR